VIVSLQDKTRAVIYCILCQKEEKSCISLTQHRMGEKFVKLHAHDILIFI